MLNRHKVINQLSSIVPQVYSNIEKELQIAKFCWDKLTTDSTIAQSAISITGTGILTPRWNEALSTNIQIDPIPGDYQVISVDGSQIYPDRHQGINCYLINLGMAHLNYNNNSKATFDSIPHVFDDNIGLSELSADIVNCKRTELELSHGFIASNKIIENSSGPSLFLCDGSLIFWHLDSKDEQTKQNYLKSYLSSLDQFYQKQILNAGFISLPKSKEIINIIRVCINKQLININSDIEINNLVDTDVLENFLSSFSRSAIFENKSPITEHYPNHLRPHFVYLNINSELARVEFPAWIARQPNKFNIMLQIIIDQCLKGRGYPVALSEAHEQAVVKNYDRDFFYQMLSQISSASNKKFKISQKSLRKRQIGI